MSRRSTPAERKPAKKSSRKRYDAEVVVPDTDFERVTPVPRLAPLEPKKPGQRRYIRAIEHNRITFATGPAGTGKTFVAASLGAEWLKDGKVDKIVITRPAETADEELGFLPGELGEKYAPYMVPLREVLDDKLGRSHVDNLVKLGKVEAVPLGFMRGRTFRRAFVILDEAQNTTPGQMKMFLTRLGEGSVMVVNGDPTQKDIKGPCGMVDAIERMADLPGIAMVHFERSDIVRDDLIQWMLERYSNE